MKRAAILIPILVAIGCGHAQVPLPATPAAEASASADRGEYIVRSVAVCGHCHSGDPKNADGALSGGREFHNWRVGTARASNLTPDPDTGLGAWSDAECVRALRNGVRRDGRLLAPVMPYEWFHGMSDSDAFAVARYFKNLPAVRNDVRQSPNLIFKFGRAVMLRPLQAMSVNAPASGATAEYGAYLANHVGLCGECHTPRTGLMAKADKSRLFAGTSNPPKGFPANPSNLTPDPDTGIGRWSESDFVQTIRTGVNPSGTHLHPFMPWHELKRMSDDDLRAMFLYLRTLPAIRNEVKRKAPGPEN
jgi:mono/diheme cytochrome c family protein